jgi:hypothetical protein
MKGNNYSFKLPNLDVLEKEYFTKKMSTVDIAKKYGVTTGAVLNKFRRNKIKLRSLSESQSVIANHIILTPEFIDFINGLLLGDGSIVLTTNKKSCWYGHSDKNREYLIWLKKSFKSFGVKCSEIKPHTNNAWSIKTLSYRDFAELRNTWYPYGKKKIPEINITPITLFNWYIGDGSYDKKSKSEKVVICSEFDQAGKIVISNKLREMGIQNSVYKNCIYIKSESRIVFFQYITNHVFSIPECYKYKF